MAQKKQGKKRGENEGKTRAKNREGTPNDSRKSWNRQRSQKKECYCKIKV